MSPQEPGWELLPSGTPQCWVPRALLHILPLAHQFQCHRGILPAGAGTQSVSLPAPCPPPCPLPAHPASLEVYEPKEVLGLFSEVTRQLKKVRA